MSARAPSPYLTALAARCPNCGKGRLFQTFIDFAPRCDACGVSFGKADVGDGAAVFVMFIVGALVVPAAFILQTQGVDNLVNLAITCLATVVLSLVLLRPVKALLFALQFKHKAAEGRLDD
jgi:uncharacterized protein (DUF983 family)